MATFADIVMGNGKEHRSDGNLSQEGGKKLIKLAVMTSMAGIEMGAEAKRMWGDGNWKWVGGDFIEVDPTTTIVHTGFALGS